ncbi:nucleic acid-binding protein [Hypomontagnella monticulosa]|nr:nucleic acid-binding protein [Hypomontagnella monticulosa]
MGRPKRELRAAAEESLTPPDQLTETQSLAKVIKPEGNSVYACSLPDRRTVLVELPVRFRNTIWLRRGGYVLVELAPPKEQQGKAEGEIVNIVGDEREWRKRSYWPKEFARVTHEDDDEDSTVGRMPPSDSEDD